MAGTGAPEPRTVDGRGLRIAIVHGRWHERIADGLLAGARTALAEFGCEVVEIESPGSFELPVLAQAALAGNIDGVVALGVIIRGGTPHFDYVAQAATEGLTHAALRSGKPIGFGVLTLDDEQQGLDRAGLPGSREDKGREAAEAVVRTAVALSALPR